MLVLGSTGQVVDNAVIIMDYRDFTIDIDIDNNQVTIHNPDGDVTKKLTGLKNMPVIVLSIITATEQIDTWHNRPTAEDLLAEIYADVKNYQPAGSALDKVQSIRGKIKDFLDTQA